jgi:hypothetical protein
VDVARELASKHNDRNYSPSDFELVLAMRGNILEEEDHG